MSRPVVLATGNPHKVAECSALLGPHNFAVQGAPKGFVAIEDGATFAANAAIKILALQAMGTPAAPEAWLLADDSGLVVPALGGAPGVHSARFAQEDPEHHADSDGANCRKLLRLLRGMPRPERRAHFVCVLALLADDGTMRTFTGEVHGHIAESLQGESGFGYDPLFVPDGQTQSFAQLGAAAKHQLSHRARAVAALLAGLGPGGRAPRDTSTIRS